MDPFGEGADALLNASPELLLTSVAIGITIALFIVGLIFFQEWRRYQRRFRELDEVQAVADHFIAAYFDGNRPVTDNKGGPQSPDPAYERRVRNALAHGVTVSYEHPDGTSSDLSLDPTSVESIEKFLKTIREEDALRGRQGEPAAPAR